MFPFSKEQIDTQIKILVTSLCTIMSAVGITNSERIGEVISAVLTAAGPIAYIYVAVALYFRMSRKNIQPRRRLPSHLASRRRSSCCRRRSPSWRTVCLITSLLYNEPLEPLRAPTWEERAPGSVASRDG